MLMDTSVTSLRRLQEGSGPRVGHGPADRLAALYASSMASSLLRAVDRVSLDIPRAAFFGLVGESGSGKTTLGRAILRAAPISGGTVTYRDGDPTGALPGRLVRGSQAAPMQAIISCDGKGHG
mgnify:CR=1 FL=1